MKVLNFVAIRSTAVLVAALTVAVFGFADGAAAQAVDMTGTWNLEVDLQGQVTNPTVTLEQEGTELTGTYNSETLGENPVTGSVDGQDVTFSFNAVMAAQGQEVPLSVTYDGTVDEEGVFTGTIDLGGMGTGTVTGTR